MEQDRLKRLQIEAAQALNAKEYCRVCGLAFQALEFEHLLEDDDYYAFIILMRMACSNQEEKCESPLSDTKLVLPIFEDDEDYLGQFL